MPATDSLIMVINRGAAEADHLKQLIEFMDSPPVQTSTPDGWREALGEQRLEALFVGPDLNDQEIDTLLADVGDLDPNVPIVLVGEHGIQ